MSKKEPIKCDNCNRWGNCTIQSWDSYNYLLGTNVQKKGYLCKKCKKKLK